MPGEFQRDSQRRKELYETDREGGLAALNVCGASPTRGTAGCDQLEVRQLTGSRPSL